MTNEITKRGFKFKSRLDTNTVYTCAPVDINGTCEISSYSHLRGHVRSTHRVEDVIDCIKEGVWIVQPSEPTPSSENTLEAIKHFTMSTRATVCFADTHYEVYSKLSDEPAKAFNDEGLVELMKALEVVLEATYGG